MARGLALGWVLRSIQPDKDWTAIGFVDGSENLDYGLGCRLGLTPFLMDFVRGAVPDRGMKPGLIAVSVQSMMSPL